MPSTPLRISARSGIAFVVPASAALTRASRSAAALMSVISTRASGACLATRIPPGPAPQPISMATRMAAVRSFRPALIARAKRYVSGPKNTASASFVGKAEWKNSSPAREDTRTRLRRTAFSSTRMPASRMSTRISAGITSSEKRRLQPEHVAQVFRPRVFFSRIHARMRCRRYRREFIACCAQRVAEPSNARSASLRFG